MKNNLLLSERNVKADNAAAQSDNLLNYNVLFNFSHIQSPFLSNFIAVSVLILYPQNHKKKNVSLIVEICNVMYKILKNENNRRKHFKICISKSKNR